MRNGLTILLLVLLTLSAFAAGFFANDLLSWRGRSVLAQGELDVFWEAWDRIETNFIGDLPTEEQRAYGAIRGSLGALGDPYTVFVEPVVREQERQSLQGTFGGVGAFLTRPQDGGDVVLEPIPGNPAAAAGILDGDILLAVDGTAVTPEMTIEDVANLIKGPKGTRVVLTVIHPGATEPVDISVVRDDILIPSVTQRILEEDPTIGYIQLTRFSGESSREVTEAITALLDQGAEKLILDVRHNGGGLRDAAVDVADHFLNGGEVLIQESKSEGERIFTASAETLAPDVPLVILVDGGTASAAEILAGALQDRGRATLIGSSKTFGKGSVQLVFDLSDGSSIHVTSARWFTPSRRQIDGLGLEPDILVEVTQEAIDNGRDEVLGRAVTFLQTNE